MGPELVLLLLVKVELEVMAIKVYSTFTWAPKLEPHNKMFRTTIS